LIDEPQNDETSEEPQEAPSEEPQKAPSEEPQEAPSEEPQEAPEESQETPAQDEGDRDAGPVDGGDPPPPAVAEASSGEVPPTSPPASDASEADAEGHAFEEKGQDEAPAEESSEPPVAEQEEESEAPAEEPEEPKAEKKKDVIPGADLEPIAVEQDERPLSAEEKARREAEEEEQRAREAALTGDSEDEEQPATRAPAKVEGDSRFLATGKRKNAIARVTLLSGSGKIEINGRPIEEFFPRPLHQTTARQPLVTTGYEGSVDVRVRVHGGGISGQAGAVRHGISRALIEVDPELRGELKKRGFLTRDARAKERRKAGLKKARKRPQFSKR
jgi:small subunit ribosomal protein S9